MNRGDFSEDKQAQELIEEDGFSSLGIDINDQKENKVFIMDADTFIFFALWQGKNEETGETNPEFEEKDLEFLYGKLTEMILKALNAGEKYFNMIALYIFIKGKNNFRYSIYPEYKANRPSKHPLTDRLYEYLKVAHQAIEATGAEAEDYVYSLSKRIGHKGVIFYVDHDLEEIPSIFYNYKKEKFLKITEKQAKFNLYKKLCLSETGDNVKTTPGIGIKYFEKNFHIDMTDDEFESALEAAYLKAWKGNIEKAQEQLSIAKQILPLKDIN